MLSSRTKRGRKRMVLWRHFALLLLLLLFIVLQRQQESCYTTAQAWTVPEKIRVDRNGTPRLAKLVGRTVALGIVRGLLGTTRIKTMTVHVQASSNRQVLLQGQLNGLQIDARGLQGPLVHLDQLQIQTSSSSSSPTISLGKWPLVCLAMPPLVWKVLRNHSTNVLFWGVLAFWMTRLYPSSSAEIQSKWLKPLRSKILSFVNGKPWYLDYKVVIPQKALAPGNKSRLLQWALQSVLRSIMLNSVLGVAAAAGDQIILETQQQQQQQQKQQQQQQQANNKRRATSWKQLPGTATSQKLPYTPPKVPPLNNNDDDKTPSFTSSSQDGNKNKRMLLTKLLEATDFVLTNTTIAKDGRLLMNADAILANNNENDNSKSKFSYTLRATVKPMVLENNKNVLSFTNPECLFATKVLVDGNSSSRFLERFLPDLWIPVGPGVALPLGQNHCIRQVETNSDENDDGGTLIVTGRFSFFQPPANRRRHQGLRLENMWKDSSTSSVPSRPLPFSTRHNNRALPPAKPDDKNKKKP